MSNVFSSQWCCIMILCSRARARTCVSVMDQTAASGDTASSRGSFLDRLGAGSGSCCYRGEGLGGARRPQFRPRTSDHSVYARAHPPLLLPAILLLTLLLLNVLIMRVWGCVCAGPLRSKRWRIDASTSGSEQRSHLYLPTQSRA
jgi:hypothetical protein